MTDKQDNDIHLRYENGVARIGINRPEKLNAIRVQTYREIIEVLQEADSSPLCHLIVIEGKGGQFTAGNDLADLVNADPEEVMAGVQGIFDCVTALQKVVVAVVEGVAVGIGTTLLLHCDIVVASQKTRFRLPFVNLGVAPEGASSVLLPREVGRKIAAELLFTGRFFSADEALRWGLINAVAEPGKAFAEAEKYIAQILKQPLDSLIETKKLMRAAQGDISAFVAGELQVFEKLLQSKATRRRISALLQR